MTLPTQSEASFLINMKTTFAVLTNQASINWQSGDATLALLQTVATQLNFIQAQAQYLVLYGRAATAVGADLDSWMADFGFAREQATYATGQIALGTASPAASPVSIPVAYTTTGGIAIPGAIIQDATGTIQYQVVPNTQNTAYNASTHAYVLPVGQSTITVTATALIAGSSSNVGAGILQQLGTSLSPITTATNVSAITNGLPVETDIAFRARFILYLENLSRGTASAIIAALEGIQQNLIVSLFEFVNAGGYAQGGGFTAVVDDGSGNPPASLITAAQATVDAYRACGVQGSVVAPTLITLSIAMTVSIVSGANLAAVIAALQVAIETFVNAITANEQTFVTVSSLIATANNVTGVSSVNSESVTINGSTNDFALTVLDRPYTQPSYITISHT